MGIKNIVLIILILTGASFILAKEKPILAVLTLNPQNVSVSDANIITGFLQEEFFYTGQYKLVERTQVDEVLREYQYQQSGVCDITCAVELGKQLAANKVIMGTVGKLGDIYTLQIKMVDVETSEIEGMSSIRAECRLGDLPTYIDDLIDKFISPPQEAMPEIKKLPEEKKIKAPEKTKPAIEELPKEEKKIERKEPVKEERLLERKRPKEERLKLKKPKISISLGCGFFFFKKNEETAYSYDFYYGSEDILQTMEHRGRGNAELSLGIIINKNFQIAFSFNYAEGKSLRTIDIYSYYNGSEDQYYWWEESRQIMLKDMFIKFYISNNWYAKEVSYYAFGGIRATLSSKVHRCDIEDLELHKYIDNSLGSIFGAGINLYLLYIESSILLPAHISSTAFLINGGIRFKF